MSISLTRVFLPLLLVLAFVVRWEPTRTLRLAPDERDLGASRWLIDDPDTCQHLRRIELAITTDKVVSFDRFVNYPYGGEIPALPLYDTMVAGIADRFLRVPEGDLALGRVHEADLEDLGVKLSPILGLLMVLATWIAARNVVSGPRGDAAALVAAAVVALYPACVSVSAAGTLAPIALACVLFALLIRSIVRCVSAEAMPNALLDAMVGGALAGILCTCTSLGIVLFVPAWIILFVSALRGRDELRAGALRAGLLFCLVAAFLARMPLNEGPWEEGNGIVRGFASGVSMLLFLSTAPFILMMLVTRNEKQRAFATLCFVAGLGVMAWQLPQVWRDLAPTVRWYFDVHALLADVEPKIALLSGGLPSLLLMLLLLLACASTWPDRRQPITLTLFAFALASCLLAVLFQAALPLAAVACACLFARALDRGLSSTEERTRSRSRWVAWLAPMPLLLISVLPWLQRVDATAREERIDFCAGLRWMRDHTQSGGAWNTPRSPSSWGVLSPVAVGPLVQYHARRPAILSPWAALSGGTKMQLARRALFGPEGMTRLVNTMHVDEAKYVVVSGIEALKRLDPWTKFALEPASGPWPSAYDSLASAESEGAFVSEYVSPRKSRGSSPPKPVISIYRLVAPAVPPQAEMRPR